MSQTDLLIVVFTLGILAFWLFHMVHFEQNNLHNIS